MARERASRPEAVAQRLFIAFDLPEPAKDAIERAIAPYRQRLPKARWVPRENWHVTLKFLGSTFPRLVSWVKDATEEVAREHVPVRTRLTCLGAFPSARRARVIWAGVDDASGRLAEIALALDRGLSREFKPEARAYSAHLTVARSEPPIAMPEGFGEGHLEADGFVVDRVILFRSYLRRPAPVYEPLAAFPLPAPG